MDSFLLATKYRILLFTKGSQVSEYANGKDPDEYRIIAWRYFSWKMSSIVFSWGCFISSQKLVQGMW